jgi:hypothetical protein
MAGLTKEDFGVGFQSEFELRDIHKRQQHNQNVWDSYLRCVPEQLNSVMADLYGSRVVISLMFELEEKSV